MKILESITSRYKKIAAGIAIVSFLAIMYFALIPGGSMAHVYGPDGGILSGVFVFIKEWPQYNTTSDFAGTYTINNMPIGEYTLVAMGNDSYAPNITNINVTTGTNTKDVTLKAAIKYYVPFLYQRVDNIYDSEIQIQNNGTDNASVEIQLYNYSGFLLGNDFILVNPGKKISKYTFDIAGSTKDYLGQIVIKSDKPVQTQGHIRTVAEGVYSIAPSLSEASTISYIPFLYQRVDNIYDSGIMVYNPGNTTANVRIILRNYTGYEMSNASYPIDSKKEFSNYVFTLTGNSKDFTGSAEIISDIPVVSQGYIRTRQYMIFSIAPSIINTVTKAYIPFLYQRVDNIYDSGVMVFNPGDITANVRIIMRNYTGYEMSNISYPVNSKNELANYVFTMTGNSKDFTGSAEIISDQPIVTQGYIRTRDYMVFSVAPQVRRPNTPIDIHIPFLYSTTSVSHDGGIFAMNPNNNPANVEVTLYYSNGTKAGNLSQTLGPYQELASYVYNIVPNSIDFDGYAIVTGDQPLVSQGYIRKRGKMIFSIAPPVER